MPALFSTKRLPLNAREKTPEPRAPAATILVVEDDRAVRLLFTKVLQAAGYEVIACENGSAGLEAARKHLETLDAIVTDAKMPGMGGQRLIARVRSLKPALPAIVVSGNLIEGTPDAITVFLCKPVTPGALTRELRRLVCDRM
jgi:two-component system C4-dicarboxylate transport response regulator DctD